MQELEIQKATKKILEMDYEEQLFLTIWYYFGTSYNQGKEYKNAFEYLCKKFNIKYKNNFNNLFEKFTQKKIIKTDGGSEYISDLYEKAFEETLKEKQINNLICKIILEKPKTAEETTPTIKYGIIAKNFNILPKQIQKIFTDAAGNKNSLTRATIVYSIIWNYNNLPTQIQKIVSEKLVHDKDKNVKEAILKAIENKAKTLPKEFKQNIFKIINNL